jgi:hypothetical protein
VAREDERGSTRAGEQVLGQLVGLAEHDWRRKGCWPLTEPQSSGLLQP